MNIAAGTFFHLPFTSEISTKNRHFKSYDFLSSLFFGGMNKIGDGEMEEIRREQVIQGSHMVSGTRCPAGSDPVKKWGESRAAAPKGRCPVEHRGEFRDVRPSVLRGLLDG